MQAVRDAAILLLLLLVVLSVRVTPLEQVGNLIPEAQAADGTPAAEAAGVRSWEDQIDAPNDSGVVMMPALGPQSPPPADQQPAPEISEEQDHETLVLIRVKRDRPDRNDTGECSPDAERSHKAPVRRSAC